MSIELKGAAFSFFLPMGREIKALSPLTLAVHPGEFIGVIGANGSGKSTLAKLMNGLLSPTSGVVEIDGSSSATIAGRISAARTVGLVQQNPDNQIIATIVEDDVAFGPENLGLPRDEIRARVDRSLAAVGMSVHVREDPHYLSAGQRQKVAIAGILAMGPKYMVMDEPTSMLDPAGRREVHAVLRDLRSARAMGLVYITHLIEEVVDADRVILLSEGKVVAEGRPTEVLSNEALMSAAGLRPPKANRLARALAARGVAISTKLITPEEVSQSLGSLT